MERIVTLDRNIALAVAVLTEHAREIIAGCYQNVDRIFRLTDEKANPPEISALAEAFGMMSVKVEAREFALEQTIEDLRQEKARVEELGRIRTQLASIFVNIVLLITFYTFVLVFLDSAFIAGLAAAEEIRFWVSRGIELITLVMVFRAIVNARLPLKSFGLTLEGWKRAALEGLAVAVLVLVGMGFLKAAVNTWLPGIFRETEPFSFGYFDFSYVTYIVVAPLQEFIARGTVQSTLERLFDGRHRGFWAILVTSFLFGALHVYSSIPLAVSCVLSSWLWGWMFHRQRTLVGVSLCHFLIGNASGLMGYWTFF